MLQLLNLSSGTFTSALFYNLFDQKLVHQVIYNDLLHPLDSRVNCHLLVPLFVLPFELFPAESELHGCLDWVAHHHLGDWVGHVAIHVACVQADSLLTHPHACALVVPFHFAPGRLELVVSRAVLRLRLVEIPLRVASLRLRVELSRVGRKHVLIHRDRVADDRGLTISRQLVRVVSKSFGLGCVAQSEITGLICQIVVVTTRIVYQQVVIVKLVLLVRVLAVVSVVVASVTAVVSLLGGVEALNTDFTLLVLIHF